jgi:chemotaxis protein MotB
MAQNPIASVLERNRFLLLGIALLFVTVASGCVSSGTHRETLDELNDVRRTAALQAQADKTTKDQLYTELMNAQENNRQLQEQIRQITESSEQVRLDRDGLRTKSDDLERKLETAKQDLAHRAELLDKALARIGALTQKEQDLNQTLSSTQGEVRELTIKLEAERAQVAALQEDKQRLLGGTTTAQGEIARLQKRAGELETEVARAKDLEKQLAERDQEIGQLRHSVADRDAVTAALASQGEELKKTRQRVDQLTDELAKMSEESAALTRERDNLTEHVAKLEATTLSLKKSKDETLASLEAQQSELKRVEQEKAEKEAEIRRLTGTYKDLENSLRSEIAQGDIKIKQVRDRLTINVVDRILFDSGSATIKPDGLKVMKSVGDVLKKVTGKQIRIDGHTDNVPISARLKDRFPSNWELSTARATSVVRYLIDEGGIAPELLTAAGHADTQAVASNDSEEGRTQNRRIEIALYPKDLGEILQSQ